MILARPQWSNIYLANEGNRAAAPVTNSHNVQGELGHFNFFWINNNPAYDKSTKKVKNVAQSLLVFYSMTTNTKTIIKDSAIP